MTVPASTMNAPAENVSKAQAQADGGDEAAMWDAYNLLCLGNDVERLRKLMVRYDLFQQVRVRAWDGASLPLVLRRTQLIRCGVAAAFHSETIVGVPLPVRACRHTHTHARTHTRALPLCRTPSVQATHAHARTHPPTHTRSLSVRHLVCKRTALCGRSPWR